MLNGLQNIGVSLAYLYHNGKTKEFVVKIAKLHQIKASILLIKG
jgi:hypothetical protein